MIPDCRDSRRLHRRRGGRESRETLWRGAAVAVGLSLFVSVGGLDAASSRRTPADSGPAPQEVDATPDSTASPQIPGDTAEAMLPEADTLPPPEGITEERSATDEEIRNALQALFDRVPSLRGVRVAVEAGVVHLGGVVLEADTQTRAAELASQQDGVLWVENDIRLDTSLSRQLEPTWQRLRGLALGFVARLPLFAVGLLIVLLSILVGARLGRWGGPGWVRFDNPFLQSLVGRFIQTAVVLAGVLIALDLLEATALVGAVAGTAGLAGLAVGFAFQDIVQNYLSGLLLALRQPFDKNDHVVVESFEGKVVRLTPRETILMTLDGNHVRLPNATVFRNPLLNYSRNPKRRFEFDAGVGPVDDLAVARRAGIEVMEEMDGVLADPLPEALVVNLGDSWVTVRFMGWVDQREADFGRVRSEAIRLVKRRLEAAGVSLPSPEYIVRMAGGGDLVVSEADDAGGGEEVLAPDFEARDVRGEQEDVSPDDAVDRQIEEDRVRSGEENLLEGEGAAGG